MAKNELEINKTDSLFKGLSIILTTLYHNHWNYFIQSLTPYKSVIFMVKLECDFNETQFCQIFASPCWLNWPVFWFCFQCCRCCLLYQLMDSKCLLLPLQSTRLTTIKCFNSTFASLCVLTDYHLETHETHWW